MACSAIPTATTRARACAWRARRCHARSARRRRRQSCRPRRKRQLRRTRRDRRLLCHRHDLPARLRRGRRMRRCRSAAKIWGPRAKVQVRIKVKSHRRRTVTRTGFNVTERPASTSMGGMMHTSLACGNNARTRAAGTTLCLNTLGCARQMPRKGCGHASCQACLTRHSVPQVHWQLQKSVQCIPAVVSKQML